MLVKRKRASSGWLKAAAGCTLLVIIMTSLAGCAQALSTLESVPEGTATLIPSATTVLLPTDTPTVTPTQAPTATPQPSATPTQPPTNTPVPPLAVAEDGLNVWCAPTSYEGFQVTSPDAPVDANLAAKVGENMQVKIPAAYCVVSARFNQPAPAGASLVMYDGKSPFLKTALNTAEGHADTLWASVNHSYVVNPPFWEVNYRLAVLSADGKELWTGPVKFAKPVPAPCPYGGLPDPITLYCGITDPKEIEPHPDVTWPPYYTRVP